MSTQPNGHNSRQLRRQYRIDKKFHPTNLVLQFPDLMMMFETFLTEFPFLSLLKVISENPAAEKAYFRRGEARMRLNDHEPAREDFAKGPFSYMTSTNFWGPFYPFICPL